MNKVKIKLMQNIIYEREIKAEGEVFECDRVFALGLVNTKRAIIVEEKKVGEEVKLNNKSVDVQNKETAQKVTTRKTKNQD